MNMDMIFRISSLDLIQGSINVVTIFGINYINNDFGVESIKSMEHVYDIQQWDLSKAK